MTTNTPKRISELEASDAIQETDITAVVRPGSGLNTRKATVAQVLQPVRDELGTMASQNADNVAITGGTFPSTVVLTSGEQTLTNKTLTAPVFSGTIGGTYTIGGTPTFPSTVVLTSGAQTLTNKTLTTPVISTISNTGTLTLPTSTDTLVGRATTDTLTNKTITSPAMSGTWSGSPTFNSTSGIRINRLGLNQAHGGGTTLITATGVGGSNQFFTYTASGGGSFEGYSDSQMTSGMMVLRTGGSGGVSLTAGGTAWAAVSDWNLKTDFVEFTEASDKVSGLRAGRGRYKTDAGGTSRAFLVAQDVQAVLPEAVSTNDHGELSLRYTEVIPLLVAAIKEQITRNNELETTMAGLLARIEALEGNP